MSVHATHIQGKEISRSSSKEIFASIPLPFQKWRSRAERTFSWYREKQKPKGDGCSKNSFWLRTERDGYTPWYAHCSSYFPRFCQTVNCISQQRLESCLHLTHGKTQQNELMKKAFPLFWNGLTRTGWNFQNITISSSAPYQYTWIVNLI